MHLTYEFLHLWASITKDNPLIYIVEDGRVLGAIESSETYNAKYNEHLYYLGYYNCSLLYDYTLREHNEL